MRTKQQWLEYKKLELIPLDEPEWGRQPALLSFLSQAWRSLMMALEQPAEPEIWQSCDRQGNTLWNAYDPMTDKQFQWSSDQELRIWLEERY
jgi:hypothetical protein